MSNQLRPLLVCRDALAALGFYADAFGARELARFVHPRTRLLSHADLALGAAQFSITEEAPAWHSNAPPTLGGSPVILQLAVADVESALERACRAGATIVFPVLEFCGERMARVRDPFGHFWLLSERVRELSVEAIRAEREAFFASQSAAGEK